MNNFGIEVFCSLVDDRWLELHTVPCNVQVKVFDQSDTAKKCPYGICLFSNLLRRLIGRRVLTSMLS
jgi:hypothetical protein